MKTGKIFLTGYDKQIALLFYSTNTVVYFVYNLISYYLNICISPTQDSTDCS